MDSPLASGLAFALAEPLAHRPSGGAFLSGASIDMNFMSGTYLGRLPSDLTCVRASSRWVSNQAGLWTKIGANALPLTDRGLSIEEARTNIVLWNRDLTNVAWTAANCTLTKDQVGVDGVANSASRLTTTGSVNSCLQAIVAGSATWAASAFVKRVNGAFAVSMTMDGGATWTDISSQINASTWSRVTIPAQTLANPSIGFKVGANAQQIAVDLVQLESGEMSSSPIDTTTVSVTEAADVVTMTVPPAFGAALSLFARGIPNAPLASATLQALLSVDDGTTSNRCQLQRLAATGTLNVLHFTGGTGTAVGTRVVTTGASHKIAGAFANLDFACAVDNQGAEASNPGVAVPTINAIHIGSRYDGTTFWNGLIERIAIWPTTRVSNAQLQAMTA